MKSLFNFKTMDTPESVEITPDNKFLICFLTNDTTIIIDISTRKIVKTIKGLLYTTISPSGIYIIGRWEDAKAKNKELNLLGLYILPEMLFLSTHDTKRAGHQYSFSSIKYSPNGEYLSCFIEDMDSRIFFFDIFNLTTNKKIKTIKCEEDSIISHDWSYIIQIKDYDIIIQDLWTQDIVNTIKGDEEYVWTLTTSPNEKYLVCGYGENLDTDYENKKDWYLKSWEIKTGKLIQTYTGSKYGPCSAVFSLDEKYLVVGWETGIIYQWDFLTGRKLSQTNGFEGHISSMSVSQDGNYLVTSSYSREIKLWNLKEHTSELEFRDQQISEKESQIKTLKQSINDLIEEGRYHESLKNLTNLEEFTKNLNLEELNIWIEKSIELVANSIVKEKILDLGMRFSRIQIAEISELTSISNHNLIISIVKEMIKNDEIYAQYFSSTKSIAFDQATNLEQIDKLMKTYEEWEEKKNGKK